MDGVKVSGMVVRVNGDRGELELLFVQPKAHSKQLIIILTDNAIKNTEENGEIYIKCIKQKYKAEVSIENSGKGIVEEDLPHVFERFYTSDTAIVFYLAAKYGKNLVVELFSEKQYEKWNAKIEGKRSYDVFLFMAILLPLFPDDFLCEESLCLQAENPARCMCRVFAESKPVLAGSE